MLWGTLYMKTQPLLPVLLGEGQPPHLFRLYIALAKHTGRLELWRGAGLTLPFAVTDGQHRDSAVR